jgi:Flp pilus assembly protein TadD
MLPFLRLLLVASCCALGAAAQAQAPSAGPQDIERAWRAGDKAAAMQRLDAAIAEKPRDVQLRFLKGVLLSESGRNPEAAEVYFRLTQEFPELPEPYNNLAVIHAAEGRLDAAREALETALRNDPGYATAHENLGDVYVRLALREYQRAGTPGPELKQKLQLARQLVAPRGTSGS